MMLRTKFTELLGVAHPIALAPMGGSAGGALAAAVSNGGGLGLVGGGRGDLKWLERELGIATERTDKPWGVGFLSWSVTPGVVERALEYGPAAVLLSFGDPRPFVESVRQAGATLIIQVTSLDEAELAVELAADVIVAQGSEAGGHAGGRATLPFVPLVVDLAAPKPVLAAGGIADGRGIAAALALGSAGALMGTRFQVTVEALVDSAVTNAIIKGRGEETERSRVLDIARGASWPKQYSARTLRNDFLDQWRDREGELEADEGVKAAFQAAAARGDPTVLPVWASEAIDLISEVVPAAELVELLAADAEDALIRAGQAVSPPTPPRA
jgi:nitronate monooxygenase